MSREERKKGEDESESDSNSDSGRLKKEKKKRKHNKSENKHKKKKKEKEKVREKSSKRKYSDWKKQSKSKKDAQDEEQYFDQEAEIKLMESMVENEVQEVENKKSKSCADFDKFNMYDNNNNRSSMINYSRRAFEDHLSSEEEEDNLHSFKSAAVNESGYSVDEKQSISPPQKMTSLNRSSAPVTNKSMAALLRSRLQKGEKLITAPTNDNFATLGRKPFNNVRNDKHSQDNDNSDLSSYMTVGELKWMSTYRSRQKGGDNDADDRSIPAIPVSGEKNYTLQELVAMEKSGGGIVGSAGNVDKIFADNILKRGSGYRGSELGFGSGVGAMRGAGGDKAGMDEEDGMGGVRSWLGTEADIDSDDNNDNSNSKSSGVPSKTKIAKLKKKEKDLVNGVDMTMFHQTEDGLNEKQIYDRIIKKAQAKKKEYSQIVNGCIRCVSGRRFRQDLVISTGSFVQLRMKSRNDSLVPDWHCELVPLMHASSILLADKAGHAEGVINNHEHDGLLHELARFKACLQRMFERLGKGVVFVETATRSGAIRHHTTVDVIPIERGMEGDVHMSFKQSFRDSGDAFSTHKKRIVETNSVLKAFHTCVPSHFPYMLVEWAAASPPTEKNSNNDGLLGLLYILDAAITVNDTELDKEDTGDFSTTFCLDVMAGVLEIDQLERRLMRQNGSGSDGLSADKSDVKLFQKEWSAVDWTSYL